VDALIEAIYPTAISSEAFSGGGVEANKLFPSERLRFYLGVDALIEAAEEISSEAVC
jgi:hypothetical protein